jgi:hypothetical protein
MKVLKQYSIQYMPGMGERKTPNVRTSLICSKVDTSPTLDKTGRSTKINIEIVYTTFNKKS